LPASSLLCSVSYLSGSFVAELGAAGPRRPSCAGPDSAPFAGLFPVRRDRACVAIRTGAVSRPHHARSFDSMLGPLTRFATQVRRPVLAATAATAMILPALTVPSLAVRGPDTISDIAEQVIDAVVNISTSQKVETRNNPLPQLPGDPQLDEL